MFFFFQETLLNEISLPLDVKIAFGSQYGRFSSIALLSLILKSSEVLLIYGKSQFKSLIGLMKLRSRRMIHSKT